MSFTTAIVRTVTGSLKLIAARTKPDQSVIAKSRENMISVYHNPRFTKEQLETLRAQAERTENRYR
jgi:hypothetical protein